MPTLEIVRCTNVDHKVEAMTEACNAVHAALYGPVTRNGRKVTIRGEITTPCTCHIDALIYLAVQAILTGDLESHEALGLFVWGDLIAKMDLIR